MNEYPLSRTQDSPSSDAPVLPLDGCVVLDFSQYLAGPSCALRLADFGADVIKIERPNGGDACRQLSIADQRIDDDSVLFHTINRNKRSFTADLKDPADLERVKTLICRADVMIHNFRPGVMERIGLSWDDVRLLNPKLVYAVVSGYGNAGPWRDKPGQDLLIQSLSGLAWLSGNADDSPVPMGVSIADILTGAHLVQGILAALLRRQTTGRGGRVDVSLMESALDIQFEQITAFLHSGNAVPKRSKVSNASVYGSAPYGIYATADGHIAVAMAPLPKLGALIACPGLAAFDDPARWFAERDVIKAILRDHLAGRRTSDWLTILEPADIWCAEVLDYARLAAHDGFAALDMTQQLDNAITTTRCPVRLDGAILKSSRSAPPLGAHTEEISQQFHAVPGHSDTSR